MSSEHLIANTPSSPIVPRANVIRTLNMLLDSHPIVVVEGPEGMGKSTLLRQFAETHDSRCIRLFVSSASRWAYDPWQLQYDLYEQLSALLGMPAEHDLARNSRYILASLYGRLRAQADRRGAPYYFVVDGLEDIPPEDDATRRQILALLPFEPGAFFRFVFSATRMDDLPLAPAVQRLAKAFTLSFFSLDEVARFLDGLGLTQEQLSQIYKVTEGLPAKLASIRRLLISGINPQDLLSNLPEHLPDLFDLEWRAVDQDDTSLHLLLALLAHDNRTYQIQEISDITGIPGDEIRAKLGSLSFVHIDPDGYYRFPTEITRRFVSSRIAHLRQNVNDLLIAHFSKNPDSPEAIAQLPNLFFTDPQRLRDLVKFLSPERFATIYKNSPSIKLVQQHADRGIAAARQLGLTADLVRFTLHRSTIEEIAASRIAVAEVRARAAIGDYDNALALVEASPRSELRLQLMVAAVSAIRDQGRREQLMPRIKELIESTDTEALGPSLADVAAELFSVSPELAIDLVTRSEQEERGENTLDWARAQMVIQAHLDKQVGGDDPHAWKRMRDLQDQIRDPTLRRLSLQVIAVLGRLSAADVIAEASRFESTADRLFLLQHWMIANRRRKDASDVLEQGVRYALQATDYIATAKTYRELALCLPYISEPERALELVDLLDAQRGVLEKVGPTEDYIRLRLILARTVFAHNEAAGLERLMDAYNEISRVDDPAVRASVTARLAATLARIDPQETLDDTLHGVVEHDLSATLNELLRQSAEQFEACKGAIQALAVARPSDALRLIERINTEYRRDLGYACFVEAATSGPIDEIPIEHVSQALDSISDSEVRDEAIETFAQALACRPISSEFLPLLEPLLQKLKGARDLRVRVRACVTVATALKASGPEADSSRRDLLSAAWEGWQVMETSWERLETGLTALAALAPTDPEAAEQYIDEIEALKRSLPIPDSDAASAGYLGMLLAIRAFAGIVRSKLEKPEDFQRLYAGIAKCGSSYEQARLLTELAVRCHFADRPELCQEIVQDELLPLIEAVTEEDVHYRTVIFVSSAPAFYLGSPASFKAHVKQLDSLARDRALAAAAWTILTRVPPYDAYDDRRHSGYVITYEQACALVELMSEMQADWMIYGFVEKLVDSALRPDSKVNYTQKQYLADILENLVRNKLPSQRFIRHQGYLVIAEAQVNRLRIGSARRPHADFVAQAKRIPNTADRAYVLAVLAALATDKKTRRQLLQDARHEVSQIPMLADRLDRYELMSELFAHSEPAASKEILKEAIFLAIRGEGKTIEARRRSLVNLAYRTDPNFAATLAQLTDDDPARDKIERQMAIYKLRDAIAAKRKRAESLPDAPPRDYSRAAWLKLGQLNAGRVSPVAAEQLLPLLQYAAAQAVSLAYPLFALFIENAVRHAHHQGSVRNYVFPLFEACLRASELALLAVRSADAELEMPPLKLTDSVRLIDAGEREKALAILRDWLRAQPENARIIVVDPYFRPQDVNLLALISECIEHPRITVLTGIKSVEGLTAPYDEHYRAAWRRIREEPIPEITVVICWTRDTKRCPIHDRWWLTESGGVQVGTSAGGLGLRISSIIELGQDDAHAILSKLKPYIRQERVNWDGERVVYSTFMLD